ncbi:SDR family oxidoreductase [Blastochloris viridis]|uniref:Enoyl-[acyl-carrier-protein] reductase [NADPH] FabL n=1 Tax=Blastochloris viridis TaxID=1079 RepID=A0A0H5BD71_BLAVI|nr:NAD(P)-dependent oxidoreductase [Blastochloris viridis]ALK09922.1 Enoyl-[acyl-carrier-protein] reductase [NADPH] FabL [Blastochloris viridis]BAS00168.1 short chain dehydrogenase family protein [Blastochloris viridis]CUU42585.1 Enoyl-[acyl-carrier-protein] reductase [NADPH] FabL [Blastochloris viridis]
MRSLSGKTLFITGASRGIGKAIALRAARDGANVVIAAKTAEPHPRLPGTIFSAAAEIEAAGGKALPLAVDIRDEVSVADAVDRVDEVFGVIDIVVNNASAISLTGTPDTPMKRFDLMMSVNLRGTFAVTQACLPLLRRAQNPHILTLSPPPSLDPEWYGGHVAYTIAKMSMSLCVLGWAEEFRDSGIAANALWPRTVIDTAALAMLGGLIEPGRCRTPAIVADAAHAILTRPARECSGNFFLDEGVLAQEGVTDFSAYAVDPAQSLLPDLFVR